MWVKCLVGTNSCYGCVKDVHMVNDFPNERSHGKGNCKAQPSSRSSEALKMNCFYALKARGEQENSPGVVAGMLQVLSINVYRLLDQGATLCFVTPLVARKFDVFPDILIELFSVCTPKGDSIVAKKIYRKYPIMLLNRVTLVYLIELDMFDFNIILGIDCLHTCFASIDCRTRVVKFQFP